MNWQSLIKTLKENDFQILNEVITQNSLFFMVIPDCMYPFRIEIQRKRTHISAKLLIDYNEYNDVRSVLRTFQPQESLYNSIKYFQNGNEIYRDNHGRFAVFDETSIKQLLEVIVEMAIEREIDYFYALEDLIFKASFAFSSKCFLNTMRAADIATEYWPESCFRSVDWDGYTVKPLRANLPFLNLDMILLIDNTLVFRIQNKSNTNLLADITEKLNPLGYVHQSEINESYVEFMIHDYNLSKDSYKFRNIIEIVDISMQNSTKSTLSGQTTANDSIIYEADEYKFKTREENGTIRNFEAFFKIQSDGINYLFYTDESWNKKEQPELSVGCYTSEDVYIDLHPIETEQEWDKLESIFNEIIEEKVRNFYKNI